MFDSFANLMQTLQLPSVQPKGSAAVVSMNSTNVIRDIALSLTSLLLAVVIILLVVLIILGPGVHLL